MVDHLSSRHNPGKLWAILAIKDYNPWAILAILSINGSHNLAIGPTNTKILTFLRPPPQLRLLQRQPKPPQAQQQPLPQPQQQPPLKLNVCNISAVTDPILTKL